ncbi:MAG: DUF1385 domain-containing protein [Myxococcaceae bacterium]
MTKPYIGGQAVLEGVMMRSPKSFVVVVRRPDGQIAVRERAWDTLWPKLKFLRWPLFRGAIVLIEAMHNGFSALQFSAEHAIPEEKPAEGKKAPPAAADGKKKDLGTTAMMVVATVLMVGLFMALPHLLTYGIGLLVGPAMDTQSALFQLVDGLLRIVILVGYILAISRTRDAKRLFGYHGAEHKAIWAYESGGPLTVAEARKFTTIHPRCGTSFLFVVVAVAVLVHLALIPFIPRLHPGMLLNTLFMFGVKLPMLFPIAGISYELQRLSAKESCPAILRWLTKPGLWMQRITTNEPSDDQLEIAVLSLERALAREEGRSKAPDGVAIYPDFAVAASI